LPEEELEKRLDLDFYDRISFFKVKLPPLRDCPEDLRDDWQKVWAAESSGLETSSKEPPEDDCLMDFFKASQLPGNFRTLELVANHIIAWNGRKTIEDILKDLASDNAEKKELDVNDFSTFENKSWQDATKCFQQHYAQYACKKYGTQSEAAKKLGCTTKTLQNALKGGKKRISPHQKTYIP
jgi:DNA-binding NtrC family response regulator